MNKPNASIAGYCDDLYDGSAKQAEAAANALSSLVVDTVDTRWAMGAVAYALTRPEVEVQRAAMFAASNLAGERGHAELATAALLTHCDSPDAELRECAWRALNDLALSNNPTFQRKALQHIAEHALAHQDSKVRELATSIVKRLADRANR
jgi:dienelactone hydrolase